MPICPLILSPPVLAHALRFDPDHLLVHAGGQRWFELCTLHALRALFSTTRYISLETSCQILLAHLSLDTFFRYLQVILRNYLKEGVDLISGSMCLLTGL